MQVYVQVSNQTEFDKALENIKEGQVIIIENTIESIAAYCVNSTIEIKDGILVAIKCKNIIAANKSKVLAYNSVVYANDNSYVLNARSTCLLYDAAKVEKIF